jgi:serpin B
VNTIYFKAPWTKDFAEGATKPMPFYINGTDAKDVPTMERAEHFGYAKRDGYTVVSLPYAARHTQFLVFVPDKADGLPELEKQITAKTLEECVDLRRRQVWLSLPKFKLEPPAVSLVAALKELGMKQAFGGPADFSRMATVKPGELALSDILHKTFITVDEKGTEAAAATVVVASKSSGGGPPDAEEPVKVKVDRPFLFAVQHLQSGACLFIGRVTDPR